MEDMKTKRGEITRGVEENTMAFLESFCSYDSSHVHDDRLAFLEAVRSSSIVSANGSPPTKKMMKAVFGILREEKSLELMIGSYRLLCELEKHFPRVYLLNKNGEQGSYTEPAELVIHEEAWSPFSVGSDGGSSYKHTAEKRAKELINAADFHLLLASLGDGFDETASSEVKLELLAKMILFQYLITIIEADFVPRNQAFLGNSNWVALRESILNKLLGSRMLNYKGLVKDCLDIISSYARMDDDSELEETSSSKLSDSSDLALTLYFPEAEKHACQALQKFLKMMMELDSSKKQADMLGLVTRVDSVRTPGIDLLVDELSYVKDMIPPFLQAFEEPELKLEIISQYLRKYVAKPSTRNRKSIDSTNSPVTGIFNGFSTHTSTKAIVKKLGAEGIQVLLAHVLQACMSIAKEKLGEISGSGEDSGSNPLGQICKNIISAFTRLKQTDKNMEILQIGKEALFTASIILSTGQ